MFACHFMLSTVSHFELLGNTFCPKPRVFRNTNYSYYKTGFTEPQELFCFCQNQLCIFSKLWLIDKHDCLLEKFKVVCVNVVGFCMQIALYNCFH